MKERIKKHYLIQIAVSFVLSVSTINFIYYLKGGHDAYSNMQVFVLSITGSVIFALINALVNALNFTYLKTEDRLTAFYMPMLLWCIPVGSVFYFAIQNETLISTDWLLVILYAEPVLYHLKMARIQG